MMKKVLHTSPSAFDHFAGHPQGLCLVACCYEFYSYLVLTRHKKITRRLERLHLKIFKGNSLWSSTEHTHTHGHIYIYIYLLFVIYLELICLHTVKWFQVFLFDISISIWLLLSNLILIICLHTVKWFQVFLSKTNNSTRCIR